MSRARCEWCGQPAAHLCRAAGSGTRTIHFCDPESKCWEQTYREVRRYPERTWKTVGRTSKTAPGQGDLFDHLPRKDPA